MKQKMINVCLTLLFILGMSQDRLFGSFVYETYLESWDSQWNSALRGMPAIPTGLPTNYDDVILNIAFASYTFPGLNGLQFSNVPSDTQSVIDYVHSQNGKVKISYGGASYAGPNYFISKTPGWPNNIPELVTGVSSVVLSYGFDGVDFDIEDSLPPATTAQEFANQLFSFLTQMRQALPTKIISLTIPGQGWGTYWEDLAKQVAATNVVDYINFMEYDIWIGASSYSKQIQADIVTYTSPVNTSPSPNNTAGWGIPERLIQLGLMPGNDDLSQYLSLSDAEDLTNFAISNGLFGVMTWDLDRDAGTDPIPSLGTPPYAYSKTIRTTIYDQLFPTNILFKPQSKGVNSSSKNKGKHKHKHKSHKKCCKRIHPFVRQFPPPHGAPVTSL